MLDAFAEFIFTWAIAIGLVITGFWGFSNHWWWLIHLGGIIYVIGNSGTQEIRRFNPDLRTRVEPRIGMSYSQVLEETTLGPHLEGCTPIRHLDILSTVVDTYYVGWGVVIFENFELTEIRYN